MWLVAIFGALLGFQLGGFLGALIGYFVGDLLARRCSVFFTPRVDAETQAQIESCFFTSVFSLMGCLAKVDGRISKEEVAQTEEFMTRMGLTSEHRRQAIELFKEGAASDFDLQTCLQGFMQLCGQLPNLKQLLLVHLISVALADRVLDEAEEQLLWQVAEAMGYSRQAFTQLMSMIKAQNAFGGGYQQAGADHSQGELALAYQALGVSADESDKDLKRAYRRLMSEYHPDKLIGQGVPEDMVREATERSQEIQAAYDLIRRSRK